MRTLDKVKVGLLVLAIGVTLLGQHLGDATPYWSEDEKAGESGVHPVLMHAA